MATRFRYELLKKYIDEDGKLIVRGPQADICQTIRQVILDIEAEASSRGLLDKKSLMENFASVEDQQAVGQLFEDLKEVKYDSMEQHLNKLDDMNNQFLLIATQRFHQLLE